MMACGSDGAAGGCWLLAQLAAGATGDWDRSWEKKPRYNRDTIVKVKVKEETSACNTPQSTFTQHTPPACDQKSKGD
jgi:hypothetical protein